MGRPVDRSPGVVLVTDYGALDRALAQKADSWPLPSTPKGHLEFFVERLVQRKEKQEDRVSE